jgi:hypothetical protein
MNQLLKWSVENSDPNEGPQQPLPQDPEKIVNLFYIYLGIYIVYIHMLNFFFLLLEFGNY